jgi:hypothetical protein
MKMNVAQCSLQCPVSSTSGSTRARTGTGIRDKRGCTDAFRHATEEFEWAVIMSAPKHDAIAASPAPAPGAVLSRFGVDFFKAIGCNFAATTAAAYTTRPFEMAALQLWVQSVDQGNKGPLRPSLAGYREAISRIVVGHGAKFLWVGTLGTIVRRGPLSPALASCFALHDALRRRLGLWPAPALAAAPPSGGPWPAGNFVCGGIAGAVVATVTYPFDTIAAASRQTHAVSTATLTTRSAQLFAPRASLHYCTAMSS